MPRLHRRSRMASLGLASTFCLAAAGTLAADISEPKSSDLVTVRGCVHGTGITTIDESGTNGMPPQRFNITGSRAMLSALKKHSGHLEEVTGTLKRGSGDGSTHVGEKKIDKGRVYIGVGSTPFE